MMKKSDKNKSSNMIKAVSLLVLVIMVATGFLPLFQLAASDGNTDDSVVHIDMISSSNNEEITITYRISEFNDEVINHNGVEYHLYSIDDESSLFKQGFPDLPSVYRSILIPDDKKMVVEVLEIDYEEYTGIDIIPSKGEISRILDPNNVPYEFNEIYSIDDWYPSENVVLHDPYILRDFRGLVVQINPIQYNAIQHKIRVVSSIAIKVSASGPGIINIIDRAEPLDLISEEFYHIYSQHFMNYDSFLNNEKYTPVSEQGNMLVICYDDFYNDMIPFVEWKNMKGQPTEMVLISEIGSSASSIDTYIENYYLTNGLTFVLLVGDSTQIPTLSASGGESDVSYSYISGDYYSDIFVGRFSAENNDHVITQVQRTVEYEKYPLGGGDWYHKGLGVASNQGPGDDGEDDDEHIDNIRNKLLSYTYSEVGQSYDPSGTSTYIANSVNSGLSIINYCGHGSTTSWGNGGGFSNTNVNALTNENMLPFVISVACVVGNFGGQTCFCEAWLRATNNGEPTGAIAHFGSSINQDWNEPMDGQDEINDILVESYSNNIKRTIGGLAFNGVMHMLDNYPSAGIDDASTWHVFGDPSVEIRTDTPVEMDVDHETAIPFNIENFEVSVVGVEDALCALSYDGVLLGAAYTDASGDAIILLDQLIPDDAEQIDLVVTAYNMIPYITTVDILTSEPYLLFNPTSYSAGSLYQNDTAQSTFEIWNGNVGVLEYSFSENCDWVEITPISGVSSGEHDTITIDIDTQGLSVGSHHCEISILSNGGDGMLHVSVYIIDANERIDVEQTQSNRGFPVRHALDGDWAAAQNFTPTVDTITRSEIYLRKFGSPQFDLVLELRKGSVEGELLDVLSFEPNQITSTWDWVLLDFNDMPVDVGMDYFIVIQPAPSGVTTSFGYEWGYAFGDQYPDGSFWFTRDGGALWRDLPSMYEFTFRTYGS